MEADIWQYYGNIRPGQVQVLGADLFNGTPANLGQFRTTTGATFPLLLNGAAGTGNENLFIPYGDRDSYAVINKQGIVRYQAYDRWPYGNRYHLDELHGCIDSLVTSPAAVDPGRADPGLALTVSPNPLRTRATIELANPSDRAVDARVEVFDLGGRVVAPPWRGVAAPGVTRIPWSAGVEGDRLAAGVYVVRAAVGTTSLARRVVLIGP